MMSGSCWGGRRLGKEERRSSSVGGGAPKPLVVLARDLGLDLGLDDGFLEAANAEIGVGRFDSSSGDVNWRMKRREVKYKERSIF